jgi:uncharacterized membrane protein
MGLVGRLRESAQPLARFGCASIGTVYVLVGVLALLALSGRLTGHADEDRMIPLLMNVPGGSVLIMAIALGMVGYIVWRAVEAIADPYEFGSHWRGIAVRSVIALSATAYGVIAVSAIRIVMGDGEPVSSESSEEQNQFLVAQVLSWPGGHWLVGAAGSLVVLTGLAQFALVARRAYTLEIDLAPRLPATRTTIHALAWYGYAARGIILSVLGYLLVMAALRSDASEVGDTDTAFDTIGGGTVGDTAFFIVALGTVAYGFFMYACALFYKFERAGNRIRSR